MSGAQRAEGLLEHDERSAGPAGPEGASAVPAGREGVEAEEEVVEEVEDFLDKLVADVVDKVDAPPPQQAAPVKVGVVPDADMENLRDLLDNLLDDNTEDEPADVCQQAGAARAAPQHDPTEADEAAGLLLATAEGGAVGAGTGGPVAPQRPSRQPAELRGIDAATDAATATASRPAGGLGVDDTAGRRKGRKGRTASRTRRRKQRTARSRSTRSSRSRSSRSRDADLRSRSRHKHSRKHKRRRRHHRSSAPLMLNVDATACSAGPVSPRVNPVFLWVKQEECRILSVVCEDYDRRNRITLTKTNNGWRAIPKTERFSAVLGPRQRPSVEDEAPTASSEADGEEEDEAESEAEQVRSPADADVRADEEPSKEEPKQETEQRLSPAPSLVARDSADEDASEDTSEDKDKCTKETDDEPLGADLLDELCNEAAERMGESCKEAVAMMEESSRPVEKSPCETVEDVAVESSRTEAERTEEASEAVAVADEDSHVEEACKETEERSEPCRTEAEDSCKDGEDKMETSCEEEKAHEPSQDTSESMEESRKDAEEIMAELCKELAERKEKSWESSCKEKAPSTEAASSPKQPAAETKQEKTPSRPCSVFDLLNLDETEHVVRLPADLEVSLVGSAPSPKPTLRPSPKHSPRPSSRPSCSPEPIRLGATTTITPISEPKQHKFLESLLASPRKSDLEQELPLDLGAPRVTKEKLDQDEPPPKKAKLDDLTLRHLLNRLPGAKSDAADAADAPQQDVKRDKVLEKTDKADKKSSKSRLLELLTVPETVAGLDPLAQLKRVLSDPDLVVPDPLLVPRARLQALVTSPAQEIPRLLAQGHKPPAPHPCLDQGLDADLCVVSLSHLQSLLQPESKQALAVEEYQRQLLEAQMLWLPYLEAAYAYPGGYLPGYDYKSQMELQSTLAAAWQETMLKGGGLDTFLNNNNYKKAPPQPPPAKVPRKVASPMPHVATPRHLSAGYDKPASCKYPPSLSSPTGYGAPPPPQPQQQHRTSRPVPAALPINNNNLFAAPQRPYQYQQQQQQRRELEKQQRREYEKQRQQQQQQQRADYEKQQEYHQQLILLQQLQLQQQILAQQHAAAAAAYPMPAALPALPLPALPAVPAAPQRKHSTEERPRKSEGSRPPTCKSLLNMLSAQREAQQQHAVKRAPSPAAPESALLAALGSPVGPRTPRVSPAPSPTAASSVPSATATAALPGAPVLDLSGNRRPSGEHPAHGESARHHHQQHQQHQQHDDRKRPLAKLKVKNLVDPNAQHRLLKLDTPVVPPPAAPPDDVAGNHLWHPLFSSQKSYNSPWQWTTVTVNGE